MQDALRTGGFICITVLLMSCGGTHNASPATFFPDTPVTSFQNLTGDQIPGQALYQAAMTLVPQTAPAYTADGQLSCSQIAGEFPPYLTTNSCTITMQNRSAEVSNPETLINSLINLFGRGSAPAWQIHGTFHLGAISMEVSPYTTTVRATFERM
jgi:hypothetical protein